MMNNLKKKLAAFLAIVTLMTIGAAMISTATAEPMAPVVTAAEPQKKSEVEETLEKVVEYTKLIDTTQPMRQLANQSIDFIGMGKSETKLAKDLTNQLITNNFSSVVSLPGASLATKIAQTALEMEKAATTKGWVSAAHTVNAVENAFDVVAKTFPGGNQVVATKNLVKSIGSYIIDKNEGAVVTIVNTASDVWNATTDAVSSAWNTTTDAVSSAWNTVTDGICSLFSSSSKPQNNFALPQMDVDNRPAIDFTLHGPKPSQK